MRFKRYYSGDGDGAADVRRRMKVLIFLVVFMFLVLALRLWFLQVARGRYYRELSESNRVRIVSIRPPRGVLYDRNGVALASNIPSYSICFTPEDAKGTPGVTARLAAILGVGQAELEKRLNDEVYRNPYQPVRLKENADFSQVSAVEAARNDLPGVMVQVELRRSYPYGDFASHLLGYIGKMTTAQIDSPEYAGLPPDIPVGQYGLEKAFDQVVRGEPGRRGVEVDATGRQIRSLYTAEPVAGDDLVLTLDYKAQKAAEDALGENAGAIVALDPNNGDVLVMASKPGFDPNMFPLGLTAADWKYLSDDKRHPLNNRALQGTFPPGSTFKLAMALAGLETGKADTEKTVTCNGGFTFGNRRFNCWQKKGHGTVALHKAIVESCDVFFYRLGDSMGIDNIAKYCKFLGLGELTGVGLRERPGLIPTTAWKKAARHEDWYPGETISCSIGQGYVNVTPIQLARMVATLTNGGLLYEPQVVRAIRHKDGRGYMVVPPTLLGKAPVKKENLDIIKEGMRGVVEEPGGTAHAAKCDKVVVGGKTGTAQVTALGKGRGKEFKDHAWFVAVAPLDDPKIAICVLVENGGHGGSTAAPLAKKVIEAYLRLDEEDKDKKLSNMTGVKAKAAMKNATGASKAAMKNRTGASRARKKAFTSATGAHVKKRPTGHNITTTAGARPKKRPTAKNITTSARRIPSKQKTRGKGAR